MPYLKNLYFSKLALTGSYINGAEQKCRLYRFLNRRVSYFLDNKIYQIECGLVLSVLLSTTIFVITVVKMLWTAPRESTTNFDHCDDEYRCR